MQVDTNNFVAMAEANQNFSKVVHLVDENGMAIIMKNNKPRYIVVDFNEYDNLQAITQSRKEKIDKVANQIIEENMEAFIELAK